ncbi:uncharacterized protein LOC128220431 isoform X2 [Mya arenaria]|uniref:uncharacterized protein LOC128220431 isoform X2 n=1 Tax=Mya arenaria TaxID=6604 RepID=UPI0022E170FC|nr:uncharacterized protein LOC128220431 isoform X2 [Mya arenaria]
MEKVHDIESMTGNDFCINCRDGKRTRKSKTLKCILVVLLISVIGAAISVIVYSLHDDHRVKRCSGHENDQTDTIMNLRDKVASLERRFRKIRQLINNKSRQIEDDTFVRTMVEYDSNKALSKVLVDDIGTEKERAGLGFATIGNDARIGSGRVRRDATDNKKVKRKGKKVKKVRRPKKKKYKVDGLSEITSRLGAGKRRRRHNSGATPAFSFKGSDGQQATPGNPLAWTNAGFDNSAFGVLVWVGYEVFTKIRILQTGQYYMEAKIAIEGRDREEYSGYLRVGLELRKTLGGTSQVLDKTYLTQDHSNFPNQPLDTISVAGLFCLKLNDVIFVAISENIPFSPIFKTGPEHARFDAYMVNSENDYCP